MFTDMFTRSRCIRELKAHGYCIFDQYEFIVECWQVHSVDGLIDARHVMDWLGV